MGFFFLDLICLNQEAPIFNLHHKAKVKMFWFFFLHQVVSLNAYQEILVYLYKQFCSFSTGPSQSLLFPCLLLSGLYGYWSIVDNADVLFYGPKHGEKIC